MMYEQSSPRNTLKTRRGEERGEDAISVHLKRYIENDMKGENGERNLPRLTRMVSRLHL